MTRGALVVVMVLIGVAALASHGRPQRGQSRPSPGELRMIEGIISLPNGNPLPYAYLRLEPESGGMFRSTTADSGGYYSFAGNFAGGNFAIVVEVSGYRKIRRHVVVASHTTEEDFRLEPVSGPREPNKGAIVSVKDLQIPSQARTLYLHGVHHMDEGRFASAEASFRKAIRVCPRYAAGFRRLAAVYAIQGRFAEAHQAIRRALQIEKGSAENYAYLGYVYEQEMKLGKAEEAFQKSIADSKDEWLAQLELGRLRYDQGNYRDAYAHLTIAHEIHPQTRSAHLLLYDDLIRLGKRKAALAELDDILARFPNCPEAAKLRKVRHALARSVSQGRQ